MESDISPAAVAKMVRDAKLERSEVLSGMLHDIAHRVRGLFKHGIFKHSHHA